MDGKPILRSGFAGSPDAPAAAQAPSQPAPTNRTDPGPRDAPASRWRRLYPLRQY